MFSALPFEPSTPISIPMPKQIKALLLDDSNFDRERIRRMSRRTQLPIILDEVGCIEELDTAVRIEQYDIIFLDYRLPVGSGIEALSLVNRDPRNRHAAKIMITGAGEIQTAVQAMQEGCHDFLDKNDLNVQKLRESMTNAMALSKRVYEEELKSAHQREVIKMGLASALQDEDVQASVARMLRVEFEEHRKAVSFQDTARASREMDALIVELIGREDDEEFVFH